MDKVLSILIIVVGLALIAGGILIYIFVIRGFIGGAIAGGMIGGGIGLFGWAIKRLTNRN